MTNLGKLIGDLRGVWQWADRRTFFRYLWNLLRCAPTILKDRTLVSANVRMRGAACHFTLAENKALSLDGEFFGIAKELCCRRVYFAMPGFEIAESDRVVDLGAQTGVFTAIASMCARKVVSVEAQAGFIPVIEANLRRNRPVAQVSLEWGLIGAGTGLFGDPARRCAASHYAGEPPPLSMSDLLAKHELDRVDLLKVDIEGSEFGLFAGDTDWLERVRRVVMEVHFEFGDPGQLSALLRRAGFEVWLVDNDQRVVTAFNRHSGSAGGYIFARRRAGAAKGMAVYPCAESAA